MAEEKPNAEQQGAEDEAVKKKSDGGADAGVNPKLVMGALVLNALVLVALSVVVWMNYSKSKSQVTLEDIATSSDPKAPAGDGHGAPAAGDKKGEDAAASNFINEVFTVTLADSKGAHFAKVDLAIEVEDDFVKDEINRLKPKIRDFIIVALSSKTYEQIESVEGRDFLREEIRNKINGYLTKGQIKNVFFTQFIVQ